jgi:hypothetical protein
MEKEQELLKANNNEMRDFEEFLDEKFHTEGEF